MLKIKKPYKKIVEYLQCKKQIMLPKHVLIEDKVDNKTFYFGPADTKPSVCWLKKNRLEYHEHVHFFTIFKTKEKSFNSSRFYDDNCNEHEHLINDEDQSEKGTIEQYFEETEEYDEYFQSRHNSTARHSEVQCTTLNDPDISSIHQAPAEVHNREGIVHQPINRRDSELVAGLVHLPDLGHLNDGVSYETSQPVTRSYDNEHQNQHPADAVSVHQPVPRPDPGDGEHLQTGTGSVVPPSNLQNPSTNDPSSFNRESEGATAADHQPVPRPDPGDGVDQPCPDSQDSDPCNSNMEDGVSLSLPNPDPSDSGNSEEIYDSDTDGELVPLPVPQPDPGDSEDPDDSDDSGTTFGTIPKHVLRNTNLFLHPEKASNNEIVSLIHITKEQFIQFVNSIKNVYTPDKRSLLSIYSQAFLFRLKLASTWSFHELDTCFGCGYSSARRIFWKLTKVVYKHCLAIPKIIGGHDGELEEMFDETYRALDPFHKELFRPMKDPRGTTDIYLSCLLIF